MQNYENQNSTFNKTRIEYQFANYWHIHNVPKEFKTPRSVFLEIVSNTEISPQRDKLFTEVIVKDIERSGQLEEYLKISKALIKRVEIAVSHFDNVEKYFPQYRARVLNAISEATCEASVAHLESCVKQGINSQNVVIGYTTNQAIDWLKEQIKNSNKTTFTKSELRELIEQATKENQ